MKIRCFSVRLKSLIQISDKAYKATAFDGSTAIFPISQIYGENLFDKPNTFWISEWILARKTIQYSHKKEAFFDSKTRKMLPTIKVSMHIPAPIEDKFDNIIKELKK